MNGKREERERDEDMIRKRKKEREKEKTMKSMKTTLSLCQRRHTLFTL